MEFIKVPVIALIALVLSVSCSSIPKPSDDFDGIIILDVERTGAVTKALGNSVLRVIDENSLLVIHSKVIPNSGRVILKLPAGVYKLKAAYTSNGKDDLAVSIFGKSVVIEKGMIQYIDQSVDFHFKKIGSESFTPQTSWKKIPDELMVQKIKEIEDNKNITFWNFVY